MAVAPFMLRNHGGHIGLSSPRADGRGKVRGEAQYAAEYPAEGLLYGYPVQTTQASGRIAAIDTAAAARVPGVVAVLTRDTAGAQGEASDTDDMMQKFMGPRPALLGDAVLYHGRIVALVVAETYEAARAAAALVILTIENPGPVADFDDVLEAGYAPHAINGGGEADTATGDVDAAIAAAPVAVDATYDTPYEHHNAMEPHAAIADWRDGALLVHDTNQSVSICAASLAATFGLKPEQIRVKSRFVGGGFGGKFGLMPHVALACLGARATGRPVKVAMTRQQNFSATGHRSRTRQRLRLAAGRDGALTAIAHESWVQCAMQEEFVEQCGVMSRIMYAAPNRLTRHRVMRMQTPAPTFMRAPGEAPGSFALESAMDELAHALDMDPIELRRVNEPARDPETGLPWSSRSLMRCFDDGAARFGWDRRGKPGQTTEGRWQIGLGVASATYPARTLPASARVSLRPDGGAKVQIAAADIGTGAYTVLRHIAAAALGLTPADIDLEIGDSTLPMAFGAGGSAGTASFGSAVAGAAAALQDALAAFARADDQSPLRGVNSGDLVLEAGRLCLRDSPERGESLAAIARRATSTCLSAEYSHQPDQEPRFATHAFGAQFAEVAVDRDTREIRLRRLLGVFAVGRVLNPRTAHSQFIGGMTMGAGQALMEETRLDRRWGQWVNRDLGEYHIPVQADLPSIEAYTIEENDPNVNALGAKGIGEIGIVGVAAAIANAVYNATTLRIRDLPITLDKLLAGGGGVGA